MNSFFQQLYMRSTFRNDLLRIEIPPAGEEVLKNPDPTAKPSAGGDATANDKRLVHKREPQLETMFHELQLIFANLHSGSWASTWFGLGVFCLSRRVSDNACACLQVCAKATTHRPSAKISWITTGSRSTLRSSKMSICSQDRFSVSWSALYLRWTAW